MNRAQNGTKEPPISDMATNMILLPSSFFVYLGPRYHLHPIDMIFILSLRIVRKRDLGLDVAGPRWKLLGLCSKPLRIRILGPAVIICHLPFRKIRIVWGNDMPKTINGESPSRGLANVTI